jgi:hypothetical protein
MMPETDPTPYPDVNAVIADLLAGVRAALGPGMVAAYLYGSLVTGDFDANASDIDVLIATAADPDPAAMAALGALHDDLARAHPVWAGRIEVAYRSVDGLRTYRTQATPIAVISPGEPFHLKEAGIDWLINWYAVREFGRTLAGPPPAALIAPISHAEMLAAVQRQATAWREWVAHTYWTPSQGYAIQTMCRALYTLRTGAFGSKPAAARWVAAAFPEWAPLIAQAQVWRAGWRGPYPDPEATLPEVRRFVAFMAGECERTPLPDA